MRNRVVLVKTIKLIRELSGVKQVEIANALGVTKSAYNQFESMKATLNINNIYAICELLGINHEWLTENSDIVLSSHDVLFFQIENKQQLHKLMLLLKYGSYLYIIIPDITVKYLPSKVPLKEFVITIAKLPNDTFCIIRTPFLRSSSDFFDYYQSMYKTVETANIPFSYFFLENFETKQEVLRKINNREISREELSGLYNLASVVGVNISLSPEEKELILKLREMKKSPREILVNLVEKF